MKSDPHRNRPQEKESCIILHAFSAFLFFFMRLQHKTQRRHKNIIRCYDALSYGLGVTKIARSARTTVNQQGSSYNTSIYFIWLQALSMVCMFGWDRMPTPSVQKLPVILARSFIKYQAVHPRNTQATKCVSDPRRTRDNLHFISITC